MIWAGLTGGIASGKSTVTALLRRKGYPVVDADILSREVVEVGQPAYDEVIRAFGPDAVLPGGGLNRKKIGELVFSRDGDRSKLDQLEGIIHPRVRELTSKRRAELAAADHVLAFYDVPLLFEKAMEPFFDRVIVVSCSQETQTRRLMARDSIDASAAQARLRAQLPLLEKVKRAHEVIENEGGLKELEAEVDRVLTKLIASR